MSRPKVRRLLTQIGDDREPTHEFLAEWPPTRPSRMRSVHRAQQTAATST